MPRFLESELKPRQAKDCLFHIIPVPYEATVSYGGGTDKGPEAILEASQQLEVWTGRGHPSMRGIYTWPAVDCSGDAEEVLRRIEQATAAALGAGPQEDEKADCRAAAAEGEEANSNEPPRHAATLPVILGGEHTVTLGVLRALKARYGKFGVVQFDAHADLRNSYEGSPYSHACVMRRAVDDLDLPLFQVGVRSVSPEEAAFRKEKEIPCLDARELWHSQPQREPEKNGAGAPARAGSLLPPNFPEAVFLTFDIDALDASLMPATGTPEPGGLFWWDALALVERCLAGRKVLGFDVVELAPTPGLHAPNYTAARLVHEIMEIVVR